MRCFRTTPGVDDFALTFYLQNLGQCLGKNLPSSDLKPRFYISNEPVAEREPSLDHHRDYHLLGSGMIARIAASDVLDKRFQQHRWQLRFGTLWKYQKNKPFFRLT
jgi:hypothetical protein